MLEVAFISILAALSCEEVLADLARFLQGRQLGSRHLLGEVLRRETPCLRCFHLWLRVVTLEKSGGVPDLRHPKGLI